MFGGFIKIIKLTIQTPSSITVE